MLAKTKQWIALAAITLVTTALAACSGGGGGGSPATNCSNPQFAGTAACINAAQGGGRIFGQAGIGTYIPGLPPWGSVSLTVTNPILMTALCQQTMDSGRGTVDVEPNLALGNPNYRYGYQGGLCTTLAQTVLTFHVVSESNILRWKIYFNGVGSPRYEGMVQRLPNGSFQSVSGSMIFTGTTVGTALNVTLSTANTPNGVIATGSMTPSVQ